jgi:hypothetical protein
MTTQFQEKLLAEFVTLVDYQQYGCDNDYPSPASADKYQACGGIYTGETCEDIDRHSDYDKSHYNH